MLTQSCPTVCDPMDCLDPIACRAPLSVGFSWQEDWSGLPFPPPGNLPDPGIQPASSESPSLQADSLPTEHKCRNVRCVEM